MPRPVATPLNVAAGERTASRSPSGRVVSIRQLSPEVVDTADSGIIQFQEDNDKKVLLTELPAQDFDKLGSIQREGLSNGRIGFLKSADFNQLVAKKRPAEGAAGQCSFGGTD